jgi:hypothetical protein
VKTLDFFSRQFLNVDPSLTAFIQTEITPCGKESVNGNIRISDCSRQIDLDFYVSDRDDVAMKLEKLETLQQEIREFARRYRVALRAKGLL